MDINKKLFFVSVASLIFLYGCGTDIEDVQQKEQKYTNLKIIQECYADECAEVISETVSAHEFKQKVDSNEYVVIDIRTPKEHQEEHIDAEQQNIDIYADNFSDKIKALDRNKKYLIYCRSGSRTKMGLNRMKAFGFDEVYDLDDGITEWKKSNFPIMIGK